MKPDEKARPLIESIETAPPPKKTPRLKRKKKIKDGEIFLETTYYIAGHKMAYQSDETLEKTCRWAERAAKGASDIHHYSTQLRTLAEQQAGAFLSGQASSLINRYYELGGGHQTPESPTESQKEEIHTEEQRQLQVAIREVERRVEESIKETKQFVQLLREKFLLVKQILQIEMGADDDSQIPENVSALETDIRMIHNHYRFALKKFSDATADFYSVQLGRETRFKGLICDELVRQRTAAVHSVGEEHGEDVPAAEQAELHKLANQIVNYVSAQVPADEGRAIQRADGPVEESANETADFPSYTSSSALRTYASEMYHQAYARNKLEVMVETTNEIFKVEKSLRELHELLTDLSTLILDQSELVDDIFLNMQSANQYIERTAHVMRESKLLSRQSRQKMIAFSLVLLLLAGGVIFILNRFRDREE